MEVMPSSFDEALHMHRVRILSMQVLYGPSSLRLLTYT
jgi:hypothetical protein